MLASIPLPAAFGFDGSCLCSDSHSCASGPERSGRPAASRSTAAIHSSPRVPITKSATTIEGFGIGRIPHSRWRAQKPLETVWKTVAFQRVRLCSSACCLPLQCEARDDHAGQDTRQLIAIPLTPDFRVSEQQANCIFDCFLTFLRESNRSSRSIRRGGSRLGRYCQQIDKPLFL
jgi:hypothetical protein